MSDGASQGLRDARDERELKSLWKYRQTSSLVPYFVLAECSAEAITLYAILDKLSPILARSFPRDSSYTSIVEIAKHNSRIPVLEIRHFLNELVLRGALIIHSYNSGTPITEITNNVTHLRYTLVRNKP